MKQGILYVKFNKTRKKEFQLYTSIERKNGRLYSYKKSLSPESLDFLFSLPKKYKILKRENLPFEVLKPEKEDKAIRFDYISGTSIDTQISNALKSRKKQKLIDALDEYQKIVDSIPQVKERVSKHFVEIFGKGENKKVDLITCGCLDLNPENIIKNNSRYYLFDYEWTFPFALPVKFVKFRALMYTYSNYREYEIEKILLLKEAISLFGIQNQDIKILLKFESNFQNTVGINPQPYKTYLEIYKNLGKSAKKPTLFEKNIRFEKEIEELNQNISELNNSIDELRKTINIKDHQIAWMEASKFWKIRNVYDRFKRLPRLARVVYHKSTLVYKREGVTGFLRSVIRQFKRSGGKFWQVEQPENNYHKWILANESINAEEIKKGIERFHYKPKISIIVPVYNVSSKWLNKCIQSILDQYYDNWELCIYDDCSNKGDTISCLEEWDKRKDKRIKIRFGRENEHISGASNNALKMATGEYIALLDNDDELAPNALYENIKLLNKYPDADMIYSDEDKITEKDVRTDPFFKPDWDLDLFLSVMYTCHLGVYRKSIIDKIGGFRKGYEGAQDYDLVLRFIEKTKPENIHHIPKILYHWRMIKTSTALGSSSKSYAYESAKKAIKDYLDRNGIKGEVVDAKAHGFYRVKRELKEAGLVSIIIPFKDQSKTLENCIDSIIKKTTYKNFEIVLVDNGSQEKSTKKYLEGLKGKERIRLLEYKKPFNYSAINNFAVSKAKGKYVLLLNNDTEVINEDWLTNMVEHAQRPEVGAVGAKLYYPNKTIQHAGVIVGMGGTAGHIYKEYAAENLGYMGSLITIRGYNAVTAACTLLKKSLFEEVGGLNEKDLPIAFNDIDLCLKIKEKGYKIIFTPYAGLIHYESLTRGYDNELEIKDPKQFKRVVSEIEYFQKKWHAYIDYDRYYNINFSLGNDGKIRPEDIQSPRLMQINR